MKAKSRRVWRYQKVIRIRRLKDGQNITQNTKDWATRTLLKPGGELRCFGRVCSSSTTNGTCCVTLGTNPVINNEWGKVREVLITSGPYPWSFMPHIFRNVNQPIVGTVILSKVNECIYEQIYQTLSQLKRF